MKRRRFSHWRSRKRKSRGEGLVIGTNCKTLSSAIGSLLRIICTKCFSRCSIIMMIKEKSRQKPMKKPTFRQKRKQSMHA